MVQIKYRRKKPADLFLFFISITAHVPWHHVSCELHARGRLTEHTWTKCYCGYGCRCCCCGGDFSLRRTSELFVNLDFFSILFFSLRFSRLNADLMTSQTSLTTLAPILCSFFVLGKRFELKFDFLRKTTFFPSFLPQNLCSFR